MPNKRKKATQPQKNQVVLYQAAVPAKPKKKRGKRVNNSIPKGRFNSMVASFLHCLVDPFDWASWGGSAKVPTGYNAMTLALRDQLTFTIIPDSDGVIYIILKPGLPCAVRVYNGEFGSLGADGTNHNYYVNSSGVGGSGVGLGVPFPDWNPQDGGSTLGVAPLWNARDVQKARVLSCAMKVGPIGPPVSVAGVAYATSYNLQQFQRDPRPVTLGGASATQIKIDGAPYSCPKTIALGRAEEYPHQGSTTIATYPGSKACPVAEACYLLARIPAAARENFTPAAPTFQGFGRDGATHIHGDTVLDVSNASTYGTVEVTGTDSYAYYGSEEANWVTCPGSTTDAFATGNVWDYPGDEVMVYAAYGMPAGFPLQVSVVQCAEVELDPSSTHRQYATPGYPEDSGALQYATNMLRRLPNVIPMVHEGASLLQSIMNTASDMRSVLSGIGGNYDTTTRRMAALRM